MTCLTVYGPVSKQQKVNPVYGCKRFYVDMEHKYAVLMARCAYAALKYKMYIYYINLRQQGIKYDPLRSNLAHFITIEIN